MEKGASQPWQEVLQEVIGEGRLDGTALREYFRPLEEWLRQENLRNQEFVGWTYDGDYCKHRYVVDDIMVCVMQTMNEKSLKFKLFLFISFDNSIDTANLQVYGGFYNTAAIPYSSVSWIIILMSFFVNFFF